MEALQAEDWNDRVHLLIRTVGICDYGGDFI